MSYRQDHDALRERVGDLEREVQEKDQRIEQLRGSANVQQRLELLERTLHGAQGELVELRAVLGGPRKRPLAPLLILGAAGVVALVAGAMPFVTRRPSVAPVTIAQAHTSATKNEPHDPLEPVDVEECDEAVAKASKCEDKPGLSAITANRENWRHLASVDRASAKRACSAALEAIKASGCR